MKDLSTPNFTWTEEPWCALEDAVAVDIQAGGLYLRHVVSAKF